MITIKQYDRLFKEISAACMTASLRNTYFEILMTGDLYRDLFDIFDIIKHSDGTRTYYYCGHPVKRINVTDDMREWFIVFKGGKLE
jgi:hypothetical protein